MKNGQSTLERQSTVAQMGVTENFADAPDCPSCLNKSTCIQYANALNCASSLGY